MYVDEWDLLDQAQHDRRWQADAERRRRVLDDHRQSRFLGDGRVIGEDAVHRRTADIGRQCHYRRCTSITGVARESKRRACTGPGDIGNNRYSPSSLIDRDLDHEPAFVIGEDHELTSKRWNDQAMHAASNAEIDLSPQRRLIDDIDRTARREGDLQDWQNAREGRYHWFH